MTYDMSHYFGKRIEGRNYSAPLAETISAAIDEKPKSKRDICAIAGRCHVSVSKVINRMHKAGEIHIAGWVRGTRGPITPLWKLGSGTDAEKPAPITTEERVKRYRTSKHGRKVIAARQKSEEFKGRRKNNASLKALASKVRTKGLASVDPLLAALMGL